MKTVVVIDDDENYRVRLASSINEHPALELVAEADGTDDGLVYIDHHRPDVVIMDIIMPKRDGVAAIKHIYEKFEGYNPCILVVTAVNTSSMERVLAELEVDYIEFKPIDKVLLARALDNISSDDEKPVKKLRQAKRQRDVADVIDEVLSEVGVRFERQGYYCIRTAMYLILDNIGTNPQVYKSLTATLNISRSGVENSIRRTINDCIGTELYRNLFGEHAVENLRFLHELAYCVERRSKGLECGKSEYIQGRC